MKVTYTNHEGFYLPNLTLPRKEEASFGRYGRLRLKYLKEHRKVLYINLLTSGELTRHLNEIDRQAREMLELLVKQMAQAQGITGQLKSEDQMAWVGAMNNIRSAAEEVVMQEISEAIVIILYMLRCCLAHGDISPDESANKVYKYAYEVLCAPLRKLK